MGPVLDLVARQHAGPRDPAHGPPRRRLGARPVPRSTAPRPSTPSTPARSAARRASSSAAAGARSSTSPTARTRPTSTRARATGCGPTPTTRPTAAAPCSAPGPMPVSADSPALDAPSRGAGAARAPAGSRPSSPPRRGPAFQAQGRWDDPDGFARAARPCTGRRCVAVGACDGPETALAGGALALVALLGGVAWWRATALRREWATLARRPARSARERRPGAGVRSARASRRGQRTERRTGVRGAVGRHRRSGRFARYRGVNRLHPDERPHLPLSAEPQLTQRPPACRRP